MDGSDEILEAYVREYRLNQDLPLGNKKQALFLITVLRELKRLRFSSRTEAQRAHDKASRWLAEKQVFHPSSHEGYNALLGMVGASLDNLRAQIEEKFPA